MSLRGVDCDSSMTNCQAANAGAEQVFTFSEKGDAQSPAPALVFDEPAVERGGLSDLLFANGQQRAEASVEAVLTSKDGSNPSRIASTDVLAPSPAPNLVLPSITDDKTFALDSAITRTDSASHLARVLREENDAPAGLPHLSSHPVEDEIGRGECTAPSAVELGGLNATTPHGTVGSERSSEMDEQGVVPKGEEIRTLVCSDRTSSDTLAHTSRSASFISSVSSFSPLTSILSPSLVSSSVLDYMNFMLISAILRTSWILYLAGIIREEVAPCLAWAWEGIGTRIWN
jgi:hypothetical protein